MGMQLRKYQHSGAQGFIGPEGSSAATATRDEGSAQPAECSTTVCVQGGGPVIREALPLLHVMQPVPWDPEINPYGSASVRTRAARLRRSPGREGRTAQGEPERGPMGCRESEGRI